MKKTISLLLSFLMLMSITTGLTSSVFATEFSGSCGVDASYFFEDSTGTLIITGKNKMTGFDFNNTQFKNYDIKTAIIQNGITSIGDRAFYECNNLTSITIPDSVTTIGELAFYHCSSLTSIKIPNSVTSLGNCTFYECNKLTSITIGNGVGSIGNEVFSGCSSINSIIIGNSVTNIGDEAFYHCKDLTEIIIPNSVISIGERAFCYCSSLTSVTIPDSVASICNSAFAECSSLTSIIIPNSVTNLAGGTFRNCKSLTNITIPNSVTSIGGEAFADCSSLTIIKIPDSVTSISEAAFYSCSNLTSILIPDSVTNIGNSAFYGTGYYNDLSNWVNNELYINNALIKADNTISGNYKIKAETKVIAGSAFVGCNGLNGITIPASASISNDVSFSDCINVKKITITKGTGKMQNYSLILYDKYTFYHYTPWYSGNSTEIVIEDGVENIGRNAFYECPEGTKIIFNTTDCQIYNSPDTIDEKATIYGYDNSTASAYAKFYGKKFVSLGIRTCSHNYVKTSTVAPTCTNGGYSVYACAVCQATENRDFTSALGHSFGTNNTNCSVCGVVNPNYVVTVTTKKPKATSISKVTKAKKSFKVTWKKVSGVTGYQITYSTSKKFTKSTTKSIKIKGSKTTSKTISKLKSKKKYYVKIRTYKTSNSKTTYSSYSSVKTVTTK